MEEDRESSGITPGDCVEEDRPPRPLSLAWISDDLLAETREVWSEIYGRPVDEDEAIEMLLNVKLIARVLLKAGREAKK